MQYKRLFSGSFVFRLFISLMVIVGLYALLVVFPRIQAEKKDAPVQQLAALQSALDENRLSLASFRQLDYKNVAASESLDTLLGSLIASQAKLEELSAQNADRLSASVLQGIDNILDLEKQLIQRYQARALTFSKILAYNPADDLKSTDTTTLMARAKDTSEELNKFAQNAEYAAIVDNTEHKFSIPSNLTSALMSSANCFKDFVMLLERSDFQQASEKKISCIDSYANTRELAAAMVVSVFAGELADKINQTITEVNSAIRPAPQ